MDDPNIIMKEYIRIEEEKARRNGKVYNWETATYGRIWDDDEVHNLRYVETEFPTIVFDDTVTFQASLSCEPMVSSLNDNEIDFRISFDESDDEDYTLGGVRCRKSWRQFILALGLHTAKEMKSVRFGAYWAKSARQIPDKGDLSAYWVGISSAGDLLSTTPSYTLIRDPMLRLCHKLIACSIAGRSQALDKVTAAGGPKVPEGASDVEEGDQAVPAPVQAPQPPAVGPARTITQRFNRLEDDVHDDGSGRGQVHELFRLSYTVCEMHQA
uniref:Uncharacterized protein n=1 Tax=Tanacetum cinerariifolium TaxID=118510 RepID=A0A6L2J359_TANCI|nr:hypothetical protein [Tanacetum cinerariifolium]